MSLCYHSIKASVFGGNMRRTVSVSAQLEQDGEPKAVEWAFSQNGNQF